MEKNGRTSTKKFDQVLVAVGRKPNTNGLGLEKLKSVFAEEAGVNKSQVSGRYDEDKRVEPMEDIFRNRTSAVDFFGGNNSYKSTLDPSVSGFTKGQI